jgi:polyphenol oxidase
VRDLHVLDPAQLEIVPEFEPFGVHAFTTTRTIGTFGSNSDESIRSVMARWDALRATIAAHGATRLATAAQVHGDVVIEHAPGWEGWLRGPRADGHIAPARGTAVAVTIADCVPVFLAHASGAVVVLHTGWRGTAAHIVERAIGQLAHRGMRASELRMHLGPAICGRCYEVSADIVRKLTGRAVNAAETVDLRAIIAGHASALGVRHITTSASCTRHHNDRFYSHRAGDSGRQVSVIVASPS